MTKTNTVKKGQKVNPLYTKLYYHFVEEMRKAVEHGCICSPERMVLLYPIFREINIEQERSKKYQEAFERKVTQKEQRKLENQT